MMIAFHRFETASAVRLTWAAAAFSVIAISLNASPCVADDPPPFGGGGATTLNEITNFTGKLKGMRQGVVIVEKDDGTEAMVALPDTLSAFEFIAEAKPPFLRRGMLVRLSGTFGPGGVPTSPISKITLFQPVNLRAIQGRGKEQYTPGVHPEARRDNRNQQVMGKATVVGSLVGLSATPTGGIITLQAGKFPLRLPVAPTTQIQIRYNNLSLAQEGDKVSVAGFYQPPNENQVKAERITVTTERVFGEPTPNADRRSRRTRGNANEVKGDAEADNDADADNDAEAGNDAEANNENAEGASAGNAFDGAKAAANEEGK